MSGLSGSFFFFFFFKHAHASEYTLISKEYLADRSQAAMKHPRSFYVKSSGNQRIRLACTPQIEARYHQINPVDSIKNAPPVFTPTLHPDDFFAPFLINNRR